MELTYRRVLATEVAMHKLINVADAKLEARLGMRIAKLEKKLSAARKDATEAINKVVTKYGVKNEKTGQPEISPDNPNREVAQKEIDGVMDEKVTLDITPVEIPEAVGGIPAAVWIDLDGMVTTKD